jgi:hypothetical protein
LCIFLKGRKYGKIVGNFNFYPNVFYILIVHIINTHTGCWWLTPEILPTLEAEIRRIMVPRQP